MREAEPVTAVAAFVPPAGTTTDTADTIGAVGAAGTVGPWGWRHNVRACGVLWRREMIRFREDRVRVLTSYIQPVLFLFVLGTGLSSLTRHGLPSGVNFRAFIYPGVLAMSVLFTAIFSASSVVWDREFGFLREMMVAPVSRTAIAVGRILGGATVATLQGLVIVALGGLANVPYSPLLQLTLTGELALVSVTMSAIGVMVAVRIQRMQAFLAFSQMCILPLFFLSGALYPLSGLPAWLSVLTRADPLTYVVSPMRDAVVSHLSISPLARAAINPAVTWNGWQVPVGMSVGVAAVIGLAAITMAARGFRKVE